MILLQLIWDHTGAVYVLSLYFLPDNLYTQYFGAHKVSVSTNTACLL